MNEQQGLRAQQLLEAALGYARHGIPVFPVHYVIEGSSCSCRKSPCTNAGKHPLTGRGFKDATTDEGIIRQYWQSNPLANIGIPTGAVAGFIVVDVDPKHDGDKSLVRYKSDHGDFPSTPRATTGSGGQHILLRHPGGTIGNRTNLLPGIDIRGDGGYIVAPPSNHASGRIYEWQPGSGFGDLPLAPIPSALIAILTDNTANTKRQTSQHERDQAADGEIPEGTRNDTLFRLACKLKRIGLGPSAIQAALYEENLTKCNPALEQDEVDRIAESAFRYSDDDHIEWDRPLPLPALEPEVPIFPAEIIPEPFRAWVQDAAERLQVPLEMVATPAMVAFSSLIGPRCGIYPKRKDTDWIVIPNLWGALVAPPGSLKSPVLKEVLKPIDKLEAAATERHEREVGDWRVKAQTLEMKIKVGEKALTESVASKPGCTSVDQAERNLAQLRAELEEGSPTLQRYMANDATIEKLGELLKENPEGLLIYRDELYGLLMGMEKQGRECERAFYLEAWNGDSGFTFDRIERGTVSIKSLCLSILGGIQPDRLGNYFSAERKSSSTTTGGRWKRDYAGVRSDHPLLRPISASIVASCPLSRSSFTSLTCSMRRRGVQP
jgi:hypothetical protein